MALKLTRWMQSQAAHPSPTQLPADIPSVEAQHWVNQGQLLGDGTWTRPCKEAGPAAAHGAAS